MTAGRTGNDRRTAARHRPAVPGARRSEAPLWSIQIAAVTRPGRPGGGDPARSTADSAAYAQVRTGCARGEAWAEISNEDSGSRPPTTPLAAVPGFPVIPRPQPPPPHPPATARAAAAGGGHLPPLIRHGRPLRLVVRSAAAASLALAVLQLIPGQPAAPAVRALQPIPTGNGNW
jgi:hypothetical protein